MRSQNSNSKWISQKFTQEAGQSNWNQYQVVLNGGARKLRIRDSDNTSTNLTTTWPVLEAGQKVILTTDYSTFANETIGGTSSVGSTTPNTNLSTQAVSGFTTLSYNSTQMDAFTTYSTGTYSRVQAYGGMADIHPEGTRAWFSGYGGVITEYVFSTPWDASTATASGNTFTSPENIASWGSAAPGFCWADDGRLFIVTGYPGMTTQAHYFTTYRAATPYDLGSLDTTGYSSFYKYTDGHLAKGSGQNDQIAFFKMSRDGTKLVMQGHSHSQAPLGGNIGSNGLYPITATLTSPFNISTIDRYIANNTTYLATGLNTNIVDTGFNMSHNGRFITKLHSSGLNATGNIYAMAFSVYSLTDPWDISSMSTTPSGTIYFPNNYDGVSKQPNSSSYNTCMHGVSPCGRYLVYTAYNGTSNVTDGIYQNRLGIVDLNGVGWDLGDGKNVDITNHNLSSAPVAAWTQAPKIYVSAETSSARCAVDPVSLAYWKDSSSTSTLVIGHEESGVLTAGDTLLLDDTSTVTISSVVESAGAYTPIIPATTGSAVTGKLHYTGRSFATGTSSQETTLISTPVYGMSHGAMCFSPDGVNLYVTSSRSLALPSDFVPNANYNNMLVRYKLSTPWNIDTAEWVQTWDRALRHTEPAATYLGAHYQIRGVAFNPQGTKLLIYCQYNSGTSSPSNKWLGEWNLATPWDLNTTQYVGLQLINVTSSNYTQTGQMSINSTGTQVSINNVRATTNGTNQRMVIDLTTPYSLSGGVSVPAAWSTNASEQGGFGNFVTKNGKYLIHSSDYSYSISNQYGYPVTVQTFGTINDLSLNSLTSGTRNTVDRLSGSQTQMNNTADWAGVYGTTNTSDLPLGFAASEDGTKLYVYTQDGTIRQFDVRLNDNMYKYTVTIPTQASVPDTVVMPSRATEVSYTSIALDDNDSDVLVLSTAEIAADSSTRAIQFKIEENAQESLVNSVKVNLWRA